MNSGFISTITVLLLFGLSGCNNMPRDSSHSVENNLNNHILSATDSEDQFNTENNQTQPDQDNENSASDTTGGNTTDITKMANWPFIPASAHIHPLSHFVTNDKENRVVINMRVEFFDRYNHNTKGLGLIRFELYPYINGESGYSNKRIEVWVEDINDLNNNLERYDDVTRTYLFPIKVKEETELPERGIIVMTIITPSKQFTDQMNIKFR